jgi:cytochrome c oxidase subunit 3
MSQARMGVLLTLLLGLLFAVFQFVSWDRLVDSGIFFAGSSASISGSYLYALSGLHLAHLAGGIISLIVVYLKLGRGRYDSGNLLGLQMSSVYWHFLGLLWVYLYIFLNFIAL